MQEQNLGIPGASFRLTEGNIQRLIEEEASTLCRGRREGKETRRKEGNVGWEYLWDEFRVDALGGQ